MSSYSYGARGKKRKRGSSINFKKVWRDICESVGSNISFAPIQFVGCCPGARICVYVLLGLTLLFSGISIYSWIIILMLILILNFL